MTVVLRLRKLLTGAAVRYLFVGGIIYGIDVLIFTGLLLLLGSNRYLAVNVMAKTLAATIGFFLHRTITFNGNHQHDVRQQFVMYVGLFLFNVALSSVMIFMLVGVLLLPPVPSRIAADVVVTITAFIVSQKIVFRSEK